VISPQVQRSAREPGPLEVGYAMLVDAGNRVAARYGLVHGLAPELQQVYARNGIDLPSVNGDGTWALPMPARFVLDRDGVIQAVDADPDYTRRPEPAATVDILRRLAS
jgi:peroxiredoxin